MSKANVEELKALARQLRTDIIDTTVWAGSGHYGGSLSSADIFVSLYFHFLKIDPKNPAWEDRDRFILSKGHCALGYIPCLSMKGFFPKEGLKNFNHFMSPFGMHPDSLKVKGCDASSGSLGHGLPMGLGMALGARVQKKDFKTVVLLGDGECNEGQIWEGAMFAAQRKLHNVIAFVDWNKKQLDGYLKDICDIGDIRQKFEDFGWYAQSVDGHSVEEIHAAIEKAQAQTDRPSMIALNTVKGKGCNFCENVFYNHNITVSAEQAQCAIDALCCEQ